MEKLTIDSYCNEKATAMLGGLRTYITYIPALVFRSSQLLTSLELAQQRPKRLSLLMTSWQSSEIAEAEDGCLACTEK